MCSQRLVEFSTISNGSTTLPHRSITFHNHVIDNIYLDLLRIFFSFRFPHSYMLD